MKSSILYLSTLCFCFALMSGVEAHRPQKQGTSQPKGSQMQQMDQGYALTVLSVRRASEWTPGTDLMRIVPKPGGTLHNIRVRVKFLGAKDDYLFSYEKVQVVDARGAGYEMAHVYISSGSDLRAGRPWVVDLPFLVPAGATLKTLKIGDATFDLAKVAKRPSSGKARKSH